MTNGIKMKRKDVQKFSCEKIIESAMITLVLSNLDYTNKRDNVVQFIHAQSLIVSVHKESSALSSVCMTPSIHER